MEKRGGEKRLCYLSELEVSAEGVSRRSQRGAVLRFPPSLSAGFLTVQLEKRSRETRKRRNAKTGHF